MDGNSGRSNGTGSSNDGGALKGLSNDSGDVSHIGELGKRHTLSTLLLNTPLSTTPTQTSQLSLSLPSGNTPSHLLLYYHTHTTYNYFTR